MNFSAPLLCIFKFYSESRHLLQSPREPPKAAVRTGKVISAVLKMLPPNLKLFESTYVFNLLLFISLKNFIVDDDDSSDDDFVEKRPFFKGSSE